jgi:uncharacterized membrane protein YjfL (UPF0719 family)
MSNVTDVVSVGSEIRSVQAVRLLRAMWGMALLATAIGVGRHVAEALIDRATDAAGVVAWAQVPVEAWMFAGLHMLAALLALPLGYLVLSWAYPLRGLLRQARGNTAAAIQASAHLLGATAVATASWGGCDAASLGVSAAFCGLGWLAVVLICAGYRGLTRYRDHEEIAAGNTATALAAAGLHLAVALVVAHAIQGQFIAWRPALIGFAVALLWALALWPLRQVVLARVILGVSPHALDEAVAADRDHLLGAVEGLFYVLSVLCLASGW